MANALIDITGRTTITNLAPSKLAYVDGYEDMRRRVPDITLASMLIDFAPSTPLDDIIRAVAAVPGSNANEAMSLAGSVQHLSEQHLGAEADARIPSAVA